MCIVFGHKFFFVSVVCSCSALSGMWFSFLMYILFFVLNLWFKNENIANKIYVILFIIKLKD